LNLTNEVANQNLDVVPPEDLDYAIASRPQTYKTSLADLDSEADHPAYQRSVSQLVKSNLGKMLNEKNIKVFKARQRTNWIGPDSVYDAWLVQNGKSREWFNFNPPKRLAILSSDEEESNRTKRRKISESSSDDTTFLPSSPSIKSEPVNSERYRFKQIEVEETVVIDTSDDDEEVVHKVIKEELILFSQKVIVNDCIEISD